MEGGGRSDAASGDDDVVVAGEFVQAVDLVVRADLYVVAAGLTEETVNDGLRVLCGRKHAMVRLHGEGHAVTLEPPVGVAVVEDIEEALQQPMATRIDLREIADILERVGTVAATAARHLDLAEHPRAALEDGDAHLRTHFLEVDGTEKACCTASDDCCLLSFSHFHVQRYKIIEN